MVGFRTRAAARGAMLAGAAAALAATGVGTLHAQSGAAGGAAKYPAATVYPKEQRALVAEHLSRARRLAGAELFPEFTWRCVISPLYPDRVRGVQYDGRTTPTRVFDNLYSVGQMAVSAYALTTSDGIILFDSLNNEDEARNLLVPNMVSLGLDPAKIKYVVTTHGHGDHWGGASYLQKTYGAKVIASAIDWTLIKPSAQPGPFRDLVAPQRDIAVADGQTLTLGDTTLTFYVTPGHTPGTLSTIFKVRDKGAPHVVGLHGGTGGGRNEEATRAHIASMERWAGLTKVAGVDVAIANHPTHTAALEKEELMRYAQPGDANPFVLGRDLYQRFLGIQTECARAMLARLGGK